MITKFAPLELSQSASINTSSSPNYSGEKGNLNSPEIIPIYRDDAVKIDRAVKLAAQATYEIVKIRERQSEILDQMTPSNAAKRDKLAAAYNELDVEITRIGSEAKYADINLITGQTFSIQSAKELFSDSLVLPNLSILTTSYALNNSDTSINATKSAIRIALSSAYVASSGFESRSDKSAKIVADINHLVSIPSDGLKRNYFKTLSTLTTPTGSNKIDAIVIAPVDQPSDPSEVDFIV
jgi:hypothetical protein